MMKKVSGILIAIIVAIGIFFLNKPMGELPALGQFFSPTHGFWQNASTDNNKTSSIVIKCINGDATVVYDEYNIPHIFADNEDDLVYAQGYVEAKDRLWQMEFQTHAAAGRLTEILGNRIISGHSVLDADRFSRRIGILRAAHNSVKEMEKDPISKKIMESFSAGVNAYIKQLKKADYPIEYKLLGYQPEAWSPLKCALLMKYMAKDLTYYDTDIENTNALRAFGEEVYKKMYPDFPPPALDPIIPVNTKWNFTSVDTFSSKNTATTKTALLYSNPQKALYANKFYGSNNWCINGNKTKSGKPILCGDPHLALNLPSIWYAIQLHCPTINVEGVTIPGAPGIVIGHNDSIAWSVTNSERDVINNFAVEYSADKKSYKLGNAYVPFEYDVQVFKIKGSKDVVDSIRMTKVGSIVYDENYGETNDKKHIATYWRAEEPSNELMTFYYLNKAKNHQDYLAALDYFSCPGQNFIYADAQNNIAIKQQGNFMLRTQFTDGIFVTPLANVDITKLKARIPNAQNPHILNPERNFCSSANQNPVDNNYPYSTSGHYENYRNRVINSVLTSTVQSSWKDMAALQSNNLSLLAKETLPTLLATIVSNNSETSNQILRALKSWNYEANINLTAPSYFYKLWSYIEETTYDELLKTKSSFRLPENYTTANLILHEPDFVLFDIKNTANIEKAQDVVQLAFQKTVAFFEDYAKNKDKNLQWSHYKNTTVTHLARIPAFSVSDIPIGGYNNIVNATSEGAGPSWRMIVDFAQGKPICYGIYPGGQSGNVGSIKSTNYIDKWSKGEYNNLHFFANKEEALKIINKQ